MKILKYLPIAFVTLFAVACNDNTPSFSLDPVTVQLTVGDMTTIDVVGNAQNIEWISSNDSVASVYYGVVTANAIGFATVTATNGKEVCTCNIYVNGTDGATLRLSPSLVGLKKGESFQMNYGNTYNLELTWSSSDESVATVDTEGLVTAIGPGNAIISLSTAAQTLTAIAAVEHTWGEYHLVWSDEFDGAELDQTVWTIQKGTGNGGWGNNEKQYYTDRSENLRVEGGNLIIQARKEDYEGSHYTSARLMTKNKKSFLYGKMEARISLPGGGGLWPAFWMMGSKGGWPACGEIDIMEYVGNVQNRILGTLHSTKDRDGGKSSKAYWGTDIEDHFHVYGIEWMKEEDTGRDVIKFYVDNDYYSIQTESVIDNTDYWPFCQPHYFILNMAVGGNLGGSINDEIWNEDCIMYVDWVRVYQREEAE